MSARFQKGDRVRASRQWLENPHHRRHAFRAGTVKVARFQPDFEWGDGEIWKAHWSYTVLWDGRKTADSYCDEKDLRPLEDSFADMVAEVQRGDVT